MQNYTFICKKTQKSITHSNGQQMLGAHATLAAQPRLRAVVLAFFFDGPIWTD